MKNYSYTSRLLTLAVITLCRFTPLSQADDMETAASKIARAMSAAPADISQQATIMDVDGSMLRQGSNGWVCLPGIGLIPGDKHPMCNDKVWMEWMKSAKNGTPFSTQVIGVSYMLAGDALVNNDNPAATDPNDGGVWVQEGPHIMLLMPDKTALANLPRNPYVGGPYVMWGNTPLVHIMLPMETKSQPPKPATTLRVN
ncbi:hypothetical protein [Dasania marina]|uniref:hypothetical protein n=1 Tax=Dasania marina TaxID=471499 RepID=UPI0030D6CD96|tara:strand:+ start:15965 stop:16561 length:597 start_codon:yes stop_codon:yes gene_type:complete